MSIISCSGGTHPTSVTVKKSQLLFGSVLGEESFDCFFLKRRLY